MNLYKYKSGIGVESSQLSVFYVYFQYPYDLSDEKDATVASCTWLGESYFPLCFPKVNISCTDFILELEKLPWQRIAEPPEALTTHAELGAEQLPQNAEWYAAEASDTYFADLGKPAVVRPQFVSPRRHVPMSTGTATHPLMWIFWGAVCIVVLALFGMVT